MNLMCPGPYSTTRYFSVILNISRSMLSFPKHSMYMICKFQKARSGILPVVQTWGSNIFSRRSQEIDIICVVLILSHAKNLQRWCCPHWIKMAMHFTSRSACLHTEWVNEIRRVLTYLELSNHARISQYTRWHSVFRNLLTYCLLL